MVHLFRVPSSKLPLTNTGGGGAAEEVDVCGRGLDNLSRRLRRRLRLRGLSDSGSHSGDVRHNHGIGLADNDSRELGCRCSRSANAGAGRQQLRGLERPNISEAGKRGTATGSSLSASSLLRSTFGLDSGHDLFHFLSDRHSRRESQNFSGGHRQNDEAGAVRASLDQRADEARVERIVDTLLSITLLEAARSSCRYLVANAWDCTYCLPCGRPGEGLLVLACSSTR